MDSSIATRLSAAKQLFTDGDDLRRRDDGAGRIQSALMIDCAVETVLKTVMQHLKIAPKKKLNLAEMAAATTDAVPSAKAFEPHRETRNFAMHAGIPPRREDLEAMSATARACLRESFTACGADFDRFNLRQLVVNPTTTVMLRAATESVSDRPDAAVEFAWRALLWVRHMAGYLAADAIEIETWHDYDPRSDVDRMAMTGDGRDDATKTVLDVLTLASLGFELPEYIGFMRRARAIGANQNSEDDAWWCIDYAARHAYRLEHHLPETRELGPEDARMTGEDVAMLPLRYRRGGAPIRP